MKHLRIFIVLLLLPFSMLAQQSVSGTVTEKSTGTGIPGVDVIIKGTTRGTSTDFDGNYTIDVNEGETLSFSFLGYETIEIVVATSNTINVALEEGSEALDEVIIVGYGTTTIKDATGSIASVKADDINKGATASAEQLLVGRVAGVSVTTSGGAPGSGSTIRIRGGSSLSASNDPLFVIDGVPVDNGGVAGSRNPLDLINPNDIESFTILKDASATAIYGSRASNGVIIITTKKGRSGELEVSYSGNVSVHENIEFIDALSTADYIDFVNANGLPTDIALLGTANTNWQNEIFETAFGTDHSIGLSGGSEKTRYRGSIGYTKLNGTLKGGSMDRATFAFNIDTKLFDDHLKVNLNTKLALVGNRFANQGAIGNAIAFDPTKPVYTSGLPYGGFYEWSKVDSGTGVRTPIQVGAPRNPVALLEQNSNVSNVSKFIGNIQFDYKMHFLPELRANLNIGIDKSEGSGNTATSDQSATTVLADGTNNGNSSEYSQDKENQLLDFYLNYATDLESINSTIDAMAGYSYQNFINKGESTSLSSSLISNFSDYYNELNLQSFFGRVKFALADKYLFTVTYRRDGSSRFSEDNRWGNFPSAAVAWKLIEEDFMSDSNTFSNLKLRLGWGITGQQDIGSFYPAIPTYLLSTDTAQYQFGDSYINTYRAEPFNSTLKWEETTTYNIGVDFGFLNNRLNGSIDGYLRETEDLLNFIPFPGGSSLSNAGNANIGSMENTGVELTLNGVVIESEDLNLDLGLNVTWNETKITKLTTNDGSDYDGVPTGGIAGGFGNTAQIHTVGYAPSSYFVYQQVYDADGKPLEDVYADLNGDGIITLDDRYRYKNPTPDVTFGFNTNLTYKNWDFTMSWRGAFGNYNYNNVDSNQGFRDQMLNVAFPDVISNGVENVLETGFINGGTARYLSDYFVQDASFVKLDNIGIGYNFGTIFGEDTTFRLNGTVQNALTITDYEGIDPEVFGGIDGNIYPRPRIYTLGVNLNF